MIRCSCCGVPLVNAELRRVVPRCLVCDVCDGWHGDRLQARIANMVATGWMPWGAGVARMLVDDAHHAAKMRLVGDRRAAEIRVEPFERWEVVIGRALARGEQPSWCHVVDAILQRYIPGRATDETLRAIERDLTAALQMMDQDVLSVEVTAKRDVLDPEHMVIICSSRNPVLGSVVQDAGVPIPDDISSRPRGSA
jgi:hypothetical protein